MHCGYCYTEFRLDFKIVGDFKAIYFTRWKDLGKDTSMIDEKWRSHLQSYQVVPAQKIPLKMSSIAAAFEHSTDFQYFHFDSFMPP